jgi:hypothetical protein
MADAALPSAVDAIEAILPGFDGRNALELIAMKNRKSLIATKYERDRAKVTRAVFVKRITGRSSVGLDFEAEPIHVAGSGK